MTCARNAAANSIRYLRFGPPLGSAARVAPGPCLAFVNGTSSLPRSWSAAEPLLELILGLANGAVLVTS
jgi:hypothetical protein